MEMPVERVVPLWRNYLKQVADSETRILRLPPSTVLDDEHTFRTFNDLHRLNVAPKNDN
jgi:hypothetical protein